jgi:hypothetical protein
MSVLKVYAGSVLVAQISRPPALACDAYVQSLPWQLLLLDGRIRRFPYLSQARDEALKRWSGCRFVH